MARLVADRCYHYPKGVPQGHTCDARIVVVGEAPGTQENKQLVPFVGESGRLMRDWMDQVGIDQREVYYTNVYPYQPPHNDIKLIPKSELEKYEAQLIERINKACPQAHIVVPTGGTALHALTGQSQITKWRGSILQAYLAGRKVKCIPTLHPAYALREPGIGPTCVLDWKRIRLDKNFPSLALPERELVAKPNRVERTSFLQHVREHPELPLSIDIETDTNGIICVGFAAATDYGLSVLFDQHTDWIRELCELPNPKVLQNGLYDLYWLASNGIRVQHYEYDTAAMFHALNPNAGPTSTSKDADDPAGGRSRIKPYSLAYMASIFTREPYYKEEAKDEGEFIKRSADSSKLERLMQYNAKDACVTLEIYEVLLEKLKNEKKLDFFRTHYASLFYPLLDLMLHGVALDVVGAEQASATFTAKCAELRTKCGQLAGVPLHSTKVYKRRPRDFSDGAVASGEFMEPSRALQLFKSEWVRNTGVSISTLKLKHHLYSTLKLPKRVHKGKVTVDEGALRSLRINYPEKAGELIDAVLEFRRTEKLASFISSGKCDADGRVRCQYKFLVQTGRLSSSSNPKGTGLNLQNVDRELRHLFLPDQGRIFLEADLSQAEDRVVKALSGSPEALELARKHPSVYDTHTHRAQALFSYVQGKELTLEDISGKQRYLAKRVVHAKNYGMQSAKLQEVLLKDGTALSLQECNALLDAVDKSEPWIGQYQDKIKWRIIRERRLTNSWGRSISFEHERLDDEVYRRAYAFTPQSEIGDLLNQWGLLALHRYIGARGLRSRINLQVHDAVIVSCPANEAYEVAAFLDASLSRPRLYEGTSLAIPTEFAISRSWAKQGRIEFKKLPLQDEFEAKVRELLNT